MSRVDFRARAAVMGASQVTKNALLREKIVGYQRLVLPHIPASHRHYATIKDLHNRPTAFIVKCLLEIFPARDETLEHAVRQRVHSVMHLELDRLSAEERERFFQYIRFFMKLLFAEIREARGGKA